MNSLENLLTKSQRLHAVFMWTQGSDTRTIAEYFNIPESIVYRDLPEYRKQHASIGEIAA